MNLDTPSSPLKAIELQQRRSGIFYISRNEFERLGNCGKSNKFGILGARSDFREQQPIGTSWTRRTTRQDSQFARSIKPCQYDRARYRLVEKRARKSQRLGISD